MPHQCTNCGRTFDDGSKEMLSGCPDCGGNKFQFQPDGAGPESNTPAEPPEPPDRPEPTGSSVARTVGKTAATVKDLVGGDGGPADPSAGPDPTAADRQSPTASSAPPTGPGSAGPEAEPSVTPDAEDTAQASARSEVVRPDELPSEPASDEHRFQPVSTPDPDDPVEADAGGESPDPDPDDRPDLQELREELNDQFESIKVLDPGKYELNLMELYDRDEYIVALQEDGRYSIQVPENFSE